MLAASGCFGFGREMAGWVDLAALGGIVTKSVSLEPRRGRPTPRMAETPSGMLNAIGLQNPGVEAFCAGDLRFLAEAGATVVASLVGRTPDEFGRLAARLDGEPGVALVEVNLSCPNVEHRGEVFATDPAAAAEVVRAVKAATAHPGAGQAHRRRHRPGRRGQGGGGRRGRRAHPDQHPARHGRRHREAPAPAGRGHRRAVRPGDPAGGRPLRLAGRPGPARGADRRHRRRSSPARTRPSSCSSGRPRSPSAPATSSTLERWSRSPTASSATSTAQGAASPAELPALFKAER